MLNSIINKLPVELHIPTYQYCGPGTKLQKRLLRGDPGKNPLDAACKNHDIAYDKYTNLADRHLADKILKDKAWQRVTSKNASLGERANALLVTNLMKAKLKLGMGLTLNKKPKNKRKISLRSAIKKGQQILKKSKFNNLKHSVGAANNVMKKIFKNINKTTLKIPRIIPIPKIGGALPFLIPLFAGLSALGAIASGTSNVVKAINATSNAKQQLDESKRHNQTIEAISMGRGLYLKPYKDGLGLYLNTVKKN